jgi:hypothetical protein
MIFCRTREDSPADDDPHDKLPGGSNNMVSLLLEAMNCPGEWNSPHHFYCYQNGPTKVNLFVTWRREKTRKFFTRRFVCSDCGRKMFFGASRFRIDFAQMRHFSRNRFAKISLSMVAAERDGRQEMRMLHETRVDSRRLYIFVSLTAQSKFRGELQR